MRINEIISSSLDIKCKNSYPLRHPRKSLNKSFLSESSDSDSAFTLITSNANGWILDCPNISSDEMLLVNAIIDFLAMDENYIPSESVMRFIREINSKITSSAVLLQLNQEQTPTMVFEKIRAPAYQ